MSTLAATPVSALVGAAVLVTFYDGAHKMHTAFAHVLAKGPADVNGNPSLTVAFPDPAADPNILASANWSRGYRRMVGVLHSDHPEVIAGKESIAWGGTVATRGELAGEGPTIPQPEGDATRPYLKRQEPAEATKVSTGQAAAVQSGKAPATSTQSPVIGESEQSQIATPVQGSAPAGAAATVPETAAPTGAPAASAVDETPGANTGTAT